MTNTQIFLQLAPAIGLLAFVVFAVVVHAKSKPHRLNKRSSSPFHYGGPWTNYDPDPDGLHPDDDPEDAGRKTKKPQRKKRRRDRS